MIKNFILKSKAIYAVLGAGIIVCLCVLCYNVRQAQAQGYSEEYLKTYAILTANYTSTFPEQSIDHALNMAETNCKYLRSAVESGRYLEWLE